MAHLTLSAALGPFVGGMLLVLPANDAALGVAHPAPEPAVTATGC